MRGKPLLVTVWVVGVVAASFATWRAIDLAGTQILTEPYRPVLSTELTPDSAEPSVDASGASTATLGKGSDIGSGQHSSKGSGPHDRGSGAQSSPTSQASPSAQPVTRTWRQDPGYIVATCTGSSLDSSATPNDGYGIEVDHQSPSTDKVHFEPKGDRGTETNVIVQCSGGVPQFAAQSGD